MPNGRRTLYTPQLCDEIVKRAMLGQWSATNEQIADYAGVDVATVSRWKAKHPEFKDAIRRSKVLVDNQVEGSLYHVAVSGNAYAMVKWLQCRRPNEWRDKQDIDLRTPDGIRMEHAVPDVAKLVNLSPEKKAALTSKYRAYLMELRECELLTEAAIDVEPDEE